MALIVSLTPVVTVATAILYRTEAVSRDRIAAFSIGVAAVVIVLLPEFDLLDSQVVWWIVLCLSYRSRTTLNRFTFWRTGRRGLDVLQIGAGETVIATLLVLPLYCS